MPVFLWAQLSSYGQFSRGITAFQQAAAQDTSDYREAYRILQEEVHKAPDSASLHYFLGYTIDRLNAEDGKTLYLADQQKTILASEQFELVNRLEPTYKGPFVSLDPYSKIASIWGSLAMSYWYNNQTDSVMWAFKEGKRRGGFREAVLDYCRNLLNSCDSSALLFTYGDNLSFSAWYLQQVEQLRTDITVVDVNLIHASWYPKLLKRDGLLDIGFSAEQLDTLSYINWSSRLIQITHPTQPGLSLKWVLKPIYMNQYLLSGDRVMLDIIRRNFFKRPVYFNRNSDSSYNLFLGDYLRNEGLVQHLQSKKVDRYKDALLPVKNLKRWAILPEMQEDFARSRDARMVVSGYRWALVDRIIDLTDRNHYNEAKVWASVIREKFPPERLPYTSDGEEAYIRELLERLQK